jgi:ribosome-associated protein
MTDELPLSKTQRKKNDHALQDLGEELVALENGKLAQLQLSERLYDAVLEAKTITKFGARSRQMQYLGRLMREDADGEAIRRQLSVWSGKSAADTAQMHLAERWRLRLLENDEALNEFLVSYPDADISRLRTLIHDTRREHAAGKAPKNFRELFRVLREALDGPGLPQRHRDTEKSNSNSNP